MELCYSDESFLLLIFILIVLVTLAKCFCFGSESFSGMVIHTKPSHDFLKKYCISNNEWKLFRRWLGLKLCFMATDIASNLIWILVWYESSLKNDLGDFIVTTVSGHKQKDERPRRSRKGLNLILSCQCNHYLNLGKHPIQVRVHLIKSIPIL